MPRRTINFLIHPFRYPEWGELLCAMLGGLQFVYALFNYSELHERPSLTLTIALSPATWTAAGLLLTMMHILALRFGGTKWGYQGRLCAAGSSLVFWSHFILTVFVNAVLSNLNTNPLLVPALAAPLLAGAVLYRLWRHY